MLPHFSPLGPESVGARRPGPAKAWLSGSFGGVGSFGILVGLVIMLLMQSVQLAYCPYSNRD